MAVGVEGEGRHVVLGAGYPLAVKSSRAVAAQLVRLADAVVPVVHSLWIEATGEIGGLCHDGAAPPVVDEVLRAELRGSTIIEDTKKQTAPMNVQLLARTLSTVLPFGVM